MKMQRSCLIRAALALTLLQGLPACDDSDDSGKQETTGDGAETRDAGDVPATGEDAGMGAGRDAEASDVDASGASSDASSTPAQTTIVDIAAGDGRFTSLVAAVTKAGLVDALSGAGPLTVFAPTDQAFSAALMRLGKTLDELSAEELEPILTYHVLSGAVKSSDLRAGPVKTLSGITAFVSTEDGAKINGANVVSADLLAGNGVIHVIDAVILPPNLAEAATLAGGFDSLLGAVTSAGLAETLAMPGANLTVFAPNDAAFAKLSAVPGGDALKNVLLYHVVAGEVLSTDLKAGSVASLLTGKSITVDLASGVRVNDAQVIAADVVTTNGVIHVIDTVLIPPS
jgi:transforming growth factor-beta-induced protein